MELLNIMLGDYSDEIAQQKMLTRGVGRLLASLSAFLLIIAAAVSISYGIVWFVSKFIPEVSEDGFSSWSVVLAFTVGGLLPFLIPSFKARKSDYSDWSRLLHYMALDNYNVSKALFRLEKKTYAKKFAPVKNEFVIVSGLARAGTTALTTQLHKSGNFHSLSYANMPFLLSPNIWRNFYSPKTAKTKERSHGDKVEFSLTSVEALEEYFFKVNLNDSFISASAAAEHEINLETYQEYLVYQDLIRSKEATNTTYLSKNNNLITRYESLRSYNDDFSVLFMFRDPLQHAYSLLQQHERFCKLQSGEPFVLEYMNWLGHHEFGLNHKPFEFKSGNFISSYSPTDPNYWLDIWVNYYSKILSFKPHKKMFFARYEDFLEQPVRFFEVLEDVLHLKISTGPVKMFEKTPHHFGNAENAPLERAMGIHKLLMERKLNL